jgi:hypothetical protein
MKVRKIDLLAKGRHLHSKSPHKARVIAAFKAATGATKVTLVKQLAERTFQAHCLRRAPKGDFASLGFFEIVLPEEK